MDNGTNNLPAVTDGQWTPPSNLLPRSKPATGADFARYVSPVLTLVAPTGMTQDERKGWLHAAHLALSDLTLGELQDGATEAMRTVDHPSKIVAAIRKAAAGGYRSIPSIVPPPIALPSAETPEQIAERAEVAAMMTSLRKKLEANAA